MVEIRRALPRDFEDLTDLAYRFTNESNLPATFSEDNTRRTLWRLIHDTSRRLFVVYDGDILAGGAILDFDNDFYDETFCYVVKFYVEVDYRGTMVGPRLLKKIIQEAQDSNCSAIFAAATAGISPEIEEKYTKLYKKFGFEFLGTFLIRKLDDGQD